MPYPNTVEGALWLKRENLVGSIGGWPGLWELSDSKKKWLVEELVKRMGIPGTEDLNQVIAAAEAILKENE